MKIPDELISGNHKKIDEWRIKESLRRTWNRRPDLLENYSLNDSEKKLLAEIRKEK